MRRVVIESPFAGDDEDQVAANVRYAEACLLDSLKRGEAPIASHLLYTRVLNDRDAEQRRQGIEAGLAWLAVAEATIVYHDLGISPGMWKGIKRAREADRPVEYRTIGQVLSIRRAEV